MESSSSTSRSVGFSLSPLASAASQSSTRSVATAALVLLVPGLLHANPPVNASEHAGSDPRSFAGGVPNVLVWQPSDVASGSGEELLADLSVLGEEVALSNDLFAYSSDLSQHEIVVGIVGIFPENHIIDATEGAALDAYVQSGGRLYLEGGDCFNEDPDALGGYDVRPIFGLNDGPDGSGAFGGDIVGINLLEAFRFDFDYAGEVSHIDRLNPATSMAILEKESGADVIGVWASTYGNGSSIGISIEYAGLFDFPGVAGGGDGEARGGFTMRQELLAALLNLLRDRLPAVDVPQSSFTFQVPLLGTSEDALTITNDGIGPLEYDLTIAYLGDLHRDEFASTAQSVSGDHVFRGNVYQAENTVPLLEIEQYMDPT